MTEVYNSQALIDTDRQLFLALQFSLNRLLDNEVGSLMQLLFSVEELSNISDTRDDYLIALRRKDRLNRLAEEIKERHPDLYLSAFSKVFRRSDELEKKHIVFQNRVQELDKVLLEPFNNPLSSCWLIMGPAGYGKTEFLEELATRFLARSWIVMLLKINNGMLSVYEQIWQSFDDASVDFGDDSPHSIGMKFAARLIAGLKNRPGFVLLLDDIDLASEVLLEDTEAFVRGLIDGWNNFGIRKSHSLRVISSTKNIDDVRKFGRLGTDIVTLSPFDYQVIRKMVDHFQLSVGFDLDDEYVSSSAAYLCHITGGHPGCLSSLLENHYSGTLLVGTWPKSDEAEHLKQIHKVLGKITTTIEPLVSPDLLTLFKHLSVLRRFNEGMLQDFLIEMDFKEKDASAVAEALLQSRLLDRKTGGLLGDNITRRLFFCDLRNGTDEDRHILKKVCDFGINTYKKRLLDSSFIRNWHVYGAEILYQQIIKSYYIDQVRGRDLEKVIFEQSLPWILDILVEGGKIDYYERIVAIDYFLKEINEWEFRFLVNFTTSDNHYSESVFRKLENKIKTFQTLT